jgi:hypothetical protein
MKKLFGLVLATSALSSSLQAALPPLYESLSEYKSLLGSEELSNKLGSAEGIQDVKRTEKGFRIATKKYNLDVDIVFEPQSQPGPAKFHFIFHDPVPLSQ